MIGGILSEALPWLVSAVVAIAGVWGYGAAQRRRGREDAAHEAQEKELKAHDRINHADTGGGATDDERLKRLQRLGQEWDAS